MLTQLQHAILPLPHFPTIFGFPLVSVSLVAFAWYYEMRVLLCSPGWLKFRVLLPPFPMFWGYTSDNSIYLSHPFASLVRDLGVYSMIWGNHRLL